MSPRAMVFAALVAVYFQLSVSALDASLKRHVDQATDRVLTAQKDMDNWHSQYYKILQKFVDKTPQHICPNPDKLIDILDDCKDKIEKIKDCRKEKVEQLGILKNITDYLKESNMSKSAQDLETTLGNLTDTAQNEEMDLDKEEKKIFQLRDDVKNFKCDCTWGDWKEWSVCTATCGNGTKTREQNKAWGPRNGGKECPPTPPKQTVPCDLPCCPVDCKWEEWGEWSPCPQVCGVSAKTRLRNQIEHICGGKSCEGKPSENKTCDAWAEDKETLDECSTTSTKLTEDIKNLKTNIKSLETNLTQTSDELNRLRQKLCEGIECKNGGTCVEGACQCPDGFSGKSCETLSCQCSTPGQGTAGKNAYKCGDGTSASCAATEECYATQPFPKEATCKGCRKPGEKDPCASTQPPLPQPETTTAPQTTTAPKEVTCQCRTPGQGTVNKNGFDCTDGTKSWCEANEECYSTSFPKEQHSMGCRAPSVTCQCRTPGQGTVNKNGFDCTDGTKSWCEANEECYSTSFPKEQHSMGCRAHEPSLKYIGCFEDHRKRQVEKKMDDMKRTNSPANCGEICKNAGYKYVAVQSGKQCFCANVLRQDQDTLTVDVKPEGDCNKKCPGDKSKMCGGKWRNSLYKWE